MAYLIKKTRTRYYNADGKLCGKADAVRNASVKASRWTGVYTDEAGDEKSVTLFRDKEASRRKLGEIVTRVERINSGLIDPALEAASKVAKQAFSEHLQNFETHLTVAGRNRDYRINTVMHVSHFAEVENWKSVVEITPESVNRTVVELRKQRSVRTVQAYLKSICGFTRWLRRSKVLPYDALADLPKPDPKSDRRRERRSLTTEEWTWLRRVTATAPVRGAMTGDVRVLLYGVAIQTGLRLNELLSLYRGNLFLTSEPPYITCKAGSTKNKKEARQYIQRDVADALRAHVSLKAPKVPVFHIWGNPADVLRQDLDDARAAWLKAAESDFEERTRREESDFLCFKNHDGHVLDFHSLRHTTGSWLIASGAHPKAVQAVMRHGTITLTMDTYGHLFRGQEAETIARMPSLFPAATLRLTGTDPE